MGQTVTPEDELRSVLSRHIRRSRAVRADREEPARPGSMRLTSDQVRGFRYQAAFLAARLPADAVARATSGGLQDSMPRAGLLSLHARVHDLGPDSWEDPRLVQVWFRWADYIVPAKDFAIFTLGCLPRDCETVHALEAAAGRLVSDSSKQARGEVPPLSAAEIRSAQVTGRFRIRWDARTTTIIRMARLEANPETCRLELARRFLRWYAPASAAQFGRWAGINIDDATRTWEGIAEELRPVDFDGSARYILETDEPTVADSQDPKGIRLLPGSDPFLYLDQEKLFDTRPAAATFTRLRRTQPSRLVNGLTGRIVRDGFPIGAWGRTQNRLTICFWSPPSAAAMDTVMAEAETMAGPIGREMNITMLESP